MITRLLRVIDVMRAVRHETSEWNRHLSGEGPATIRRQREAAARALAALLPNPAKYRTAASERKARRGAAPGAESPDRERLRPAPVPVAR
jgi:hypothetical protein